MCLQFFKEYKKALKEFDQAFLKLKLLYGLRWGFAPEEYVKLKKVDLEENR